MLVGKGVVNEFVEFTAAGPVPTEAVEVSVNICVLCGFVE